MNVRTLSMAAVLSLSAVPVGGQESREEPPEALFQRAWYQEMAEGRFEDALEVYQRLAARAELPELLRARALFRTGVCQRKLQRKDESQRTFERAIKEFPNIQEIVRAAELEIKGETEADAAFRLKVNSLIKRLGERPASEMVPAGRGARRLENPVLVSLREVGPRAAPILMSALGSGDYFTCHNAAIILVEFAEDDPSTVPAVIGALRSGDDIVRQSLIDALDAAAGGVWTEKMVELLEDTSPDVRLASVRILGQHMERLRFTQDRDGWVNARRHPLWPRLLSGLSQAVADSSGAVRAEALRILGRLAAGEAMETIESAFSEPDVAVRQAAVEAAFRAQSFGRPSDHDDARILQLLDDPSPEIVATAVSVLESRQQALTGSGGRSVLPPGDRGGEAVARLASIARSPASPASVRVGVVHLLEASKQPEALPLLIELVRDQDADVVKAAVESLATTGDRTVVPVLIDVFTQSDDESVRNTIWSQLSSTWKSPGTVEALVERLPQLDGHAWLALDLIDSSKRRDLVLTALRHFSAVDASARRRMIRITASIAGKDGRFREGLEVVCEGLEDDDPSVLFEAAKAAGSMPHTELVPGLIRALGSDREDIRAWAITSLQRTGDARAVPALVDSLTVSTSGTPRSAAEALKTLADRSVVPQVLELLREDADLPLPEYALRVLVHHAAADDAQRIGAALQTMRPDVRVEVIELLGRLESPAAVPFVRRQLEARDPRVRQAAVASLVEIGSEDVLPVVADALADPDSGVRGLAAGAIDGYDPRDVRAQPGVLENLIACLSDQSWETRVAAVDALAHLRAPESVPALIEALKEGDSRPIPNPKGPNVPINRTRSRPDDKSSIAYKATQALLDFGDASVVPSALEILETEGSANVWLNPDYAVALLERHVRAEDAPLLADSLGRQSLRSRWRTLQIIGTLKSREVVPVVLECLRDESDGVRVAAVNALASIGGEEAFGGLVQSLSDSDANVRRAAVRALGRSNHPGAFAALLAAFGEESSRGVLEQLISALENSANPAAIPALVENVRDSKRAVWNSPKFEGKRPADYFGYSAIGSLRHYPPNDARQALLTILEGDLRLEAKKDALVVLARTRPPDALAIVNRYTKPAESKDLRTFAISLLGSFLEKSALPYLLELFKDPDPDIREAARQSIDEIRYYLNQKSFAENRGPGGQALSELLKLLSHEDAVVRLAAVKALTELKAPETLAPLVRLRKDPDPDVRKAVDAALDALSEE